MMATVELDMDACLRDLHEELDRTEQAPPLYSQIEACLIRRIERGEWRSGQALPTIKQWTARLGVSEMTVRRALAGLSQAGWIAARRGSGTVVAGEGGRSGGVARSSIRRLRLGVVFASLRDGYPFVQPMLQPLETEPVETEQDGGVSARLHILHLGPHESDPHAIRHQLPLDELDGLMLMSPVNTALLWLCQRRGMPYVLLFNDLADGVSTCVTCDYHAGMHEAMAHAASAGRRRPALVTAGDERFSTGRITDAFRHAARLHGLAVTDEAIVCADYTQQQGHAATMRLLGRPDRPDVIFYSSDHQACGGLMAAGELGLSVPGDVSVIGAGGVVGPMQWPQRLSTIDLSLAAMGRSAAQAIGDQIAQAGRPMPRRIVVPTRFIPGQTA